VCFYKTTTTTTTTTSKDSTAAGGGKNNPPGATEGRSRMSNRHHHEKEDTAGFLRSSHDGTRIIHVLPAQLDPTLAAPATYALAVAIFLELALDRRSMEKITVVLDVRAGTGWANPSPLSLLPFIKIVAVLLNAHFPERLHKLVLFPLPRAATFLFNTAKMCLDQDTASKMEICPGPGNNDSPVPAQVRLFFNDDAIQTMEQRRLSLFLVGP
jgi:hypothetical protein